VSQTLVIGGALFDGTGGRYTEGAAILVEQSRISAIGKRVDFGQDFRGNVVDASGLYVVPGLINVHAHLTFMYRVGPPPQQMGRPCPETTVHAVRTAALLLSQGITTARDMGGRDGIPVAIRNAIEAGEMPGPRIITCGRPICVTGGHGAQICAEADGPDGVRRAARQELRDGADFVKVMASHDPWPMPGADAEQTRPEMQLDEIRAAFAEAEAWGKPTACHVMGTTAIERVVSAGVRILEHGQYLTPALAQEMARRHVYYTPTLSSYDAQTMQPRFGRGEAWARAHDALIPAHRRAIEAALQAGIRILNGTDSVGCYAEEVDLLRRYGMTAADTLASCTLTAAQALGMDGEIGTIAPGKYADIVALRGDPLADPFALEEVEFVMKAGRLHRPGDLTYAERTVPPGWDMVLLARHAVEAVGRS
jgi:imidazolonepropionase-like amidohydrolase